MNLGIITASIATLRPLFANLGSLIRVSSDTVQEPYASDRPFVRHSKAAKAGRKLTGILLDPMGITKRTDLEITQNFHETSEEQV